MFSYSLPSPPPKHIEKVISPFLRALQFNVMHNIALVSLSSTQHTGFRSVVCSWLVFPSYCSCCNGSYAPEAKWRNRVIFKYISRFNQFSSLSRCKCSYFFPWLCMHAMNMCTCGWWNEVMKMKAYVIPIPQHTYITHCTFMWHG